MRRLPLLSSGWPIDARGGTCYALQRMASVTTPHPPGTGVPGAAAGERGYFSISQAAALLGVSRVSIWRWIRAGQLPVARLGHRTARIKREDVERLLVPG